MYLLGDIPDVFTVFAFCTAVAITATWLISKL